MRAVRSGEGGPLAKIGLADQNRPKLAKLKALAVAKVGLVVAKVGRGQSRSWPNLVVAKLGLAKQGHSRGKCTLSPAKARCERQCETTVGALVGETLHVELAKVRHWCGWTTSFQASTWQRLCWRNGMLWRSHLLPNPSSNPNQWNQSGRQTACSWENWICAMRRLSGHPRESRRHDHSDE